MKMRFGLILLVVLQVLTSCVTAPKKIPPKVAPYDAKKELSRIQIEIAAGDKRAILHLQRLIAKNPKTDVADDATYDLAKLYYVKSMFEQSYQAYMSLVNSDVFSPNEAEALNGAAHCLHKMGRLDEALALNARGLAIPGLSDGLKLDFQKHRYNLLTALGDQVDALKALAYIHDHEPSLEIKANVQARANDVVSRRLSQSDLEKSVDNPDFGFVRPQMAYRLALFRLGAKDYDGARNMFAKAAELGKGTPVEQQAQIYLTQIDSRRRVDPYTIGTVLPLSGKYAPYAQKTLKGLELGLGIYGPNRTQMKLAVMDSEGTPEGAQHGVERLVTEDAVIAIVGSLLSRTATSVAQKSEELGVPSMALSQKAGLTEGGSYIFRDAVTSDMQVSELVHVAMDELGMKKFAILFPNDSYGVEYSNLFWDDVLAKGGQITGAQPYNPQETDFRGPIKRLIGTYYVEDRRTEYEARLRDWFKKQKSLKTRNSPPDDLLPPIADFDAIFVPDGPKAVGQIAPMLVYQGVDNPRLLGTNVWNTSELIRRGQKNVENSLFVDSNITNDPSFKSSKFYTDFKKTFGDDPGVFEAQGYEVGTILRQLILGGETTRVGLAQALTNIKQFQGVSGAMAMNSQRELVRPLIPLTVKDGTIVTWTPGVEIPQEDGKAKSIKK